jgi:hypothetical protein
MPAKQRSTHSRNMFSKKLKKKAGV